MKTTFFLTSLLIACLAFPLSAQEQTKYYIKVENEQGVVLEENYESLEALRADADRLAEFGVTVDENGRVITRQQGGGRQRVMVQQYTGDKPLKPDAFRHRMRRPHPPGQKDEHAYAFRFFEDSTLEAMDGQIRKYMEVIHERLDSLQADAMVWVSGDHLDSLREQMKGFRFDAEQHRHMADSLRQYAMQFRWKADEHRAQMDSLRIQLKEEMEFMFNDDGRNVFFYESEDAGGGEIRVIRIEQLEAKEEKKAGIKNKKDLSAESLTIYPNPSHNTLNVRFHADNEAPVTLKITDMQGREVYSSRQIPADGAYRHEANLQSLQPGMYILYLEQNNRQLAKKIIIE